MSESKKTAAEQVSESGSPDSRVERGMSMEVQKPEKCVERTMQ